VRTWAQHGCGAFCATPARNAESNGVISVDARIAQLHARNPHALRLAELSAFAVRLEPHLLRALRRAFAPHADPSAELDLWHSTLVASRGASAALLEVEALARLRMALSRDPQRDAVYRKTLECLDGYPPLHRFEVGLNALPVLDPEVEDKAIGDHFAPLLVDLRQGGGAAQRVARWLLQAAPRWHPRVRDTAAAWAALLAPSALLEGRRLITDDPPRNLPADELARALPASLAATREVGVMLTRRYLRFLPAGLAGGAHVNVPAMSPALMVLERENDSQTQVINAEPGSETPTGGVDAVILRSLTGEVWRVNRPRRGREPIGEAPQPEFAEEQAPAAEARGPGQSPDADDRETRGDAAFAPAAPLVDTPEPPQAIDAALRPAASAGPERLFYLSYSSADDVEYIEKFFGDLDRVVAQLLGSNQSLGFFNKRNVLARGDWERVIAENLTKAKVLICIYSPNYFARLKPNLCAREFFTFVKTHHHQFPVEEGERVVRAMNNVIPILWYGLPDLTALNLPPPALRYISYKLNVVDPKLEDRYMNTGLRRFVRYGRSSYFQLVDAIARPVRDCLLSQDASNAVNTLTKLDSVDDSFWTDTDANPL
jgi:hypothetical protein